MALIELFVARLLAEHFVDHPSIQVEIQPNIWLDTDRQEKGIPDIVLRSDGHPHLVLDTKYKSFDRRPEEADRNQMVTYCHTLGLPRGVLVYADDRVIDHRAEFKGITLHAQSLALHGSLDAFKERCQTFAKHFEDAH